VRGKCKHIPDRNEREHYAQALFKHSKRLYCSGALPAMHGYELDMELEEGADPAEQGVLNSAGGRRSRRWVEDDRTMTKTSTTTHRRGRTY
jgi:hypothetical protein